MGISSSSCLLRGAVRRRSVVEQDAAPAGVPRKHALGRPRDPARRPLRAVCEELAARSPARMPGTETRPRGQKSRGGAPGGERATPSARRVPSADRWRKLRPLVCAARSWCAARRSTSPRLLRRGIGPSPGRLASRDQSTSLKRRSPQRWSANANSSRSPDGAQRNPGPASQRLKGPRIPLRSMRATGGEPGGAVTSTETADWAGRSRRTG
jgi:hypothetical protein